MNVKKKKETRPSENTLPVLFTKLDVHKKCFY